jgi:hypothetical protein
LRERFFWNVAFRNSVAHSARGEPAMGGVVVYDLNSVEGRRGGSVMSILVLVRTVDDGLGVKMRTKWEQLELELFAEFLWVWG